jgi:hypothetical protein
VATLFLLLGMTGSWPVIYRMYKMLGTLVRGWHLLRKQRWTFPDGRNLTVVITELFKTSRHAAILEDTISLVDLPG